MTSDLTLLLVSRLTGCTHLRVIDPTQAAGFPMNIVALLPYLIQHFDMPDKLAMEIAHNIGRVSVIVLAVNIDVCLSTEV